MSTDVTAAAAESLIDDGAIEPTSRQVVVSAVISYFWAGILPGAILPLGFLITFLRLGSLTGAVTWGARFRFGRRILIASVVAATLGFLVRAGLFIQLVGSTTSLVLSLF